MSRWATFCSTCQANVRRKHHLSSARHRAATRARFSGHRANRARPAWMVALRCDDEGTAEENAAAAVRLGLSDWSAAQ